MSKAQELRAPAVAAEITVDYPQERERVISPDYTFRVAARAASRVEISIDQNEWRPCRQAEGYWWYDWSGYVSGNTRRSPGSSRRMTVKNPHPEQSISKWSFDMLCDFLVDHRDLILDLTRQKTADISEARPSSEVLERGLPIFYEHLIAVLRDEVGSPHEAHPKADLLATSEHGKELSRLGYTVSQVVYGYGVICQAITETAGTMDVGFGAREFSVLNLCLDKAIAEAVTEFEKAHDIQSGAAEIKRLGFLVHELRNAL